MKLCTDIIYIELERCFDTQKIREHVRQEITCDSSVLVYSAPLLFQEPLRPGNAYILTPEQKNSISCAPPDVLCITVSEEQKLEPETDELLCEQINVFGTVFNTVFNFIQAVFDRYSNWERKLTEISNTSGDIREMCLITSELIDEIVQVYDENIFPYVGVEVTQDEKGQKKWKPTNSKGVLSTEDFIAVHNTFDFNLPERGLFRRDLSETAESQYYAIGYNMYGLDHYIGSTVLKMRHEATSSDILILCTLSKCIEQCFTRGNFKKTESDLLHLSLTQYLEGAPTDLRPLQNLQCKNGTLNNRIWYCVVLRPKTGHNILPLKYLCTHIETNYNNNISVIYKNEVYVFYYSELSSEDYSGREKLASLLSTVDYNAGISLPFRDIEDSRVFAEQAALALEIGKLQDEEQALYSFDGCLYHYLIFEHELLFPADFLLPRSLQRILDHDRVGKSDYWQTLKCYLDHEMNATDTAKALYIHRSSFLQRLSKIEAIMGEELHHPERRLVIRILMAKYSPKIE